MTGEGHMYEGLTAVLVCSFLCNASMGQTVLYRYLTRTLSYNNLSFSSVVSNSTLEFENELKIISLVV